MPNIAQVERVSFQDLYNGALIRTGQYLAQEEIAQREFPLSKFIELVKYQVYPLYSKYVYRTEYKNFYVVYNSPVVFSEPAPEIVCRVVPVSVYGLYIGEFMNFRFLSHVSYLSTRPLSRFAIVWRYEKPRLWVSYQGEVEVKCGYKLILNESEGWVEVENSTRDVFQDLCSAYVMVAIGRSRRAVRIGDSNIEFDAEGMVTEGEELLKEARERLQNLMTLETLNF